MTNTLAPMILTNLFALGMADRKVSMCPALKPEIKYATLACTLFFKSLRTALPTSAQIPGLQRASHLITKLHASNSGSLEQRLLNSSP